MSHGWKIEVIHHEQVKRKSSDNRVGLTNITNRPKRNCRRISNFRTLEIQEAFENLDILEMEPPSEKRRRSEEATRLSEAECSVDADPIQMFGLKLVNILGTHYFDVKDRLQLTVMPRCSIDVKNCSRQHTKSNPPEMCDFNISFGNENERPVEFLQSLTAMLARNEFPGETMILSLFKLMLTINKSANQILAESLNVLTDTLFQYPPCWPGAKDVYLRVLANPLVANADFISEKYNKELGIFVFLIDSLEFLMENDEGAGGSRKGKGRRGEAVDSEDNAFNFYLWEMQQIAAKNLLFDKLPRDEKITRIFIIMAFLVDLLEKDLVMWILKHPKNVSEYMESDHKRPLIAHVVWPDGQEVGQLNGFVKKIIKVFIHAVMLRYPSNSKQILGRLFNLLAIAMNLSENQFDGIMYPFLRSKSEMLVKELSRQVEASSYYDVDNVLAILDATPTPYVRMLFVDHVCNKLYPHKGTPSIHKYWQNFQNKLWQTSGTVSATTNLVVPTSSRSSSLSVFDRYPLLEPDHSWVTRKLKFDQQQYLQLLLVGIKSYFSVYRVHDLIKVSKSRNSSEAAAAVNENHRVTLPTIPTIVFAELLVDVNVMVYYRDELKYFVLLRNLIGDYKVEFGAIFNEYDEFLKQCMES